MEFRLPQRHVGWQIITGHVGSAGHPRLTFRRGAVRPDALFV
jgi:hypothetical protein